nr:TetR/AcrR family transcriptional regulator [Mumia quercus]
MGVTDTTTSRPRGGRLPRSARRAQLLEAAREIFVDNGYHAAAMDDIAERAGVSKPVLYQHFPGKLELYLALLDSACDTVVDAVRDALASTDDNKARVQATIDVFYSYVASDQAAFRLVFESDITNEPEVRRRVDRVNTETASAVAAVIHDDTGLPEVAAELLAVSLVGMAHVGARYWLDQGSALSKDDAVAMVSALSWRGIGGFPRTDEPELG